MERILEFTGKKTTEKEWILRPENAREFQQNAAFSKINRGFSVMVNAIFLAVFKVLLRLYKPDQQARGLLAVLQAKGENHESFQAS